MRRVRLDSIDLRILKDLQEDGRMTNVELARRAGISAPPCLRRVRALETAGYIRGYHAELDAKMLGYTVTIFAYVGLRNQTDSDIKRFEQKVDQWPEVRDCFLIAGEYDFLLRVVAEDWEAYQAFLSGHLTVAENVDRVKSTLAIRRSKRQPGVPIDLDRPLDED